MHHKIFFINYQVYKLSFSNKIIVSVLFQRDADETTKWKLWGRIEKIMLTGGLFLLPLCNNSSSAGHLLSGNTAVRISS